jgi:endonuclease YncB( thermonuclease family)
MEKTMMLTRILLWILIMMGVAACGSLTETADSSGDNGVTIPEGEVAQVTRVIDGDTIDVLLDGKQIRIRYVGVNTPERDEPCYDDATQANRDLVEGKTVTLVTDTSNTDRYDRLLRYIYADGVFVNDALVRNGYAEAVLYQPDDAFYEDFLALEKSAAAANRGCHSTGIFDDGSDTR